MAQNLILGDAVLPLTRSKRGVGSAASSTVMREDIAELEQFCLGLVVIEGSSRAAEDNRRCGIEAWINCQVMMGSMERSQLLPQALGQKSLG